MQLSCAPKQKRNLLQKPQSYQSQRVRVLACTLSIVEISRECDLQAANRRLIQSRML
jgi:hypothetical protein